MNFWSIAEFIFDLFYPFSDWRLSMCLFAGLILAYFAVTGIPYDPLRWIVAAVILIGSVFVGHRWERGVS